MSKKRILSVECVIPGDLSERASIGSDVSLLDYDIILFNPTISGYRDDFFETKYQGKPRLSEHNSFRLKEDISNWRRKINDAIEAGITIIMFLDELEEYYIDTGKKKFSGTGKDRETITIVKSIDNYELMPRGLKQDHTSGTSMKLTKDGEILADYWTICEKYSKYKVLIGGEVTKKLIVTKRGSRVVSAMLRYKGYGGTILLLPHLDFDHSDFFEEDDEGKMFWTEVAQNFGHKFLNCIIEIDKTIKMGFAFSPTPEWVKSPNYILPKEADFRSKLLRLDNQIEKLQDKQTKLKKQMGVEGELRFLLYEKGKVLENAIIKALEVLGFTAKNYNDGDSEFDILFESKEGRFLGEAEGKDKKAIKIDKFRQLQANILEDLDRVEVNEPAKGVLFGNAYRLEEIENREEFFTEKCISSAKQFGCALVKTTDLFNVVQYLSEKTNRTFATKCRKAILYSKGLTQFPEIPKTKKPKTKIKVQTS